MWYKTTDPASSAALTGGATFTPSLGWVTFTKDGETGPKAGTPFINRRDAVYIPTIQKSGEAVSLDVVNALRGRALMLGLAEQEAASGVWILSETGEPQVEFVWRLAGAPDEVDPAELRELAIRIRQETNQDAVAYEVNGVLNFVPGEPDGYELPEYAAATARAAGARLWIVPLNDAEASAAIDMLLAAGEQVLVSRQGWGANVDGLEKGVVAAAVQFRAENPDAPVYALELRGDTPWGTIHIDSHRHEVAGADTMMAGGLPEIASIIGVELSRYQRLVAANDAGYIPAMLAIGATQGEVNLVRAADRCAQGLTPDDERQAALDLASAEFSDGPLGRRVIIPVTTRRETAHTDRLFGQVAETLCKGVNSWDYYGPRWAEFRDLKIPGAWANGDANGGYWGVSKPGRQVRSQVTELFNQIES